MDVTSACESSLNTGIQRVIRNLWSVLIERRPDAVPIVWDNKRCSYYSLSKAEGLFLKDPFHGKTISNARPRSSLFSKTTKRVKQILGRNLENLVSLQDSNSDDTLLIPEIARDRRILYFNLNKIDANKVALFYDAISWKFPEFSPGNRAEGFSQYMDLLAKMDIIVAISDESKDDLIHYWRSKNLLFHGTISTLSLPVHKKIPEIENVQRIKSNQILSVGTLELRKNYKTLLEACEVLWKESCDFSLTIIGRALKGQSEEVIKKIKSLQIQNYPIEWLMHIDDETLNHCYESAYFTVYPSIVEGFGLPIIESLYFNKPCICNKEGAISETAKGGGCLLTDVKTSEPLVESIRQLLQNDELHQKLTREINHRTLKDWSDYYCELEQYF